MILKNNKIFAKIFKVLFLTIIFISFTFFIYMVVKQKEEILKSLSLEVNSMASLLVYINTDAIILNDGYSILDYTNKFMEKNHNIKSIIFSKINDKSYVIKNQTWSYEDKINELFISLQKEVPTYEIIHSPLIKDDVFHYSYPIVFSDTKWGWLHLSISLDRYNVMVKKMYTNFIILFIIMLFVTIILSYFIARLFSKPIIHLNEIIKDIAEGHYELRSDYKSDDEIGQLSDSFNNMIHKIKLSQDELKESNVQLKDEMEKRLSQEVLLIQQSRLAAMGEMIGNIAHQWRQPLSLITTTASGMIIAKEIGMHSDEKVELERLDGIMNSANYLSKTIDDFRNFFKEDKLKESFELGKKVDESLRLIKDAFEVHYIKVELNYTSDKKVYGAANECSQAFLNILSNAKDALVSNKIENPKVKIAIFEKKGYICLTIEDNAGGIKKDIMKKIFDPYFTTKHKSQGTGIGLYMTKVIIEQNMKGKIEVKNGEAGAIFSICLPLKED